MKGVPTLRSDALNEALEKSLSGKPNRLEELLTRASGLPGNKANVDLALAVGESLAAQGKRADKLIERYVHLSPEEAPGNSALEFLPMCGVVAVGARGTRDPKFRANAMQVLHDVADDFRFRVREAVTLALISIGERDPDGLVADLDGWTDGFFHSAAAVRALMDPRVLHHVKNDEQAIARLIEALDLYLNAGRADKRYPGHKELGDALIPAIVAFAVRHGAPIFDALTARASAKDPDARAFITLVTTRKELVQRFRGDVRGVVDTVKAADKPRRDPRTYVGETRGRGRKSQKI